MPIVDGVMGEISYIPPAGKELGCVNGSYCATSGGAGEFCKPKNLLTSVPC
jgi:hypothetical protein